VVLTWTSNSGATEPDDRCIAADETYVYWVDGTNLMRYTK
jgi:hypothetical protein